MKILITFKVIQSNPDRKAKEDLAQAYFSQHPRLSFEPRNLMEHAERVEYQKLVDEANDCGEAFISEPAEGLLVSVVPDTAQQFHYFLVLYQNNFYTLRPLDVLSARYVETIPSPYNASFELSAGILSHG